MVGVVLAGKNKAPIPNTKVNVTTTVESNSAITDDAAGKEVEVAVKPETAAPADKPIVEQPVKQVVVKKEEPKANPVVKAESVKTIAKKLPRLLELGSDKCVPCKMMAPILDDLAQEYKDKLNVEFIDVWKNREAGEKYNIKSIPTQIFFDSKEKEIFRHVGYFPKEDIINKFKELGIDFKAAPDPSKNEGK